jgi:hypothetical protein
MVKSVCEAVNADPMGWSDYTGSRLNCLLLFLLRGRLRLAGLLADAAFSLERITGLFPNAAFLFANTFRWHFGLLA